MNHQIEIATHNFSRVRPAWQGVLEAALGAWGEQLRRLTQLGFALFSPRLLAHVSVQQSHSLLADRTVEVLNAQAAVVGTWLRSPWWLVGVGSPADLPTSFLRLFEANSQLAEACAVMALAWQRALTTPTETARVVATVVGTRAEQGHTPAFQRPPIPGGGIIKGKLNQKGERIYHLPGQMNYDRLKADTWFETEEQARGSGFRRAKR